MSEILLTIFLLFILFVLLGSGVWVAFSLLSVGIVGIALFTDAPLGEVMATTIWGASNSWALAALPLFIWMGEILFRSRLSQDMFTGLSPWMNRLPGRLLHVNIFGCAIFAAVSGSSAATAATPIRQSRFISPGIWDCWFWTLSSSTICRRGLFRYHSGYPNPACSWG